MANDLPPLLAGPVLRRCEPKLLTIWIATSVEPTAVDASVWRVQTGGRPGAAFTVTSELQTVQVGTHLHIVLVICRPERGELPVGTLLGYDFAFGHAGGDFRLSTSDDHQQLVYKGIASPSYFLQDPKQPLVCLQGSCRKAHGLGRDALPAADTILSDNLEKLIPDVGDMEKAIARPSVLFLTGDQIYADDVSERMFAQVTAVAKDVLGFQEHFPDHAKRGGFLSLADIPWGPRRKKAARACGFTTVEEEINGHMLGLGEYAALYLLAWSPALWTRGQPWPDPPTSGGGVAAARESAMRRLRTADTEEFGRSIAAVRRLLANVPTYLVFDDHEVTDDWNINDEWVKNVMGSAGGARAIVNAMVAFWLFQGWGNEPDAFGDLFIDAIKAYCQRWRDTEGTLPPEASVREVLEQMLRDWTYAAPTVPLTLCMDTRTKRVLGKEGAASGLISDKARKTLKVLKESHVQRAVKRQPLILISATPLFGVHAMEVGQNVSRWLATPPEMFEKELRRRTEGYYIPEGDLEFEYELWFNNKLHRAEFIEYWLRELRPAYTVVFSGDVHYAFSGKVAWFSNVGKVGLKNGKIVGTDLQERRFLQLTSSALKNKNDTAQKALYGDAWYFRTANWLFVSSSDHRIVIRTRDNRFFEFTVGFLKLDMYERYLRHWLEELDVESLEEVAFAAHDAYYSAPVFYRNNIGLVVIAGNEVKHELIEVERSDADPRNRKIKRYPRVFKMT